MRHIQIIQHLLKFILQNDVTCVIPWGVDQIELDWNNDVLLSLEGAKLLEDIASPTVDLVHPRVHHHAVVQSAADKVHHEGKTHFHGLVVPDITNCLHNDTIIIHKEANYGSNIE